MQRPFKDNRLEAADRQHGAVSRAVESPKLWRVAAVVLSICVAVLLVANLVNFGIIGDSGNEASTEENADNPPPTDGGATATDDEPSGPASDELDVSELAARGEASGGPWVATKHEPFRFKLEGVVSSEEERQGIEFVANSIYGADGEVNLRVDPSVGKAAWAGSPDSGVVQVLFVTAYRTIEGEMLLTDSLLEATGVAPSGDILGDVWAESVGNAANADPAFSAIEINTTFRTVDRRTMTFDASFDEGKLVLAGEMPNQEIIDIVLEDAEVLFGSNAVVNEIVVAPDTFALVPTSNLHVVLASFKPFRTFDFTIENETLTARVIYGIDFEPDKSELDEVTKDALDGIVRLLNFAKVPVTVVGYTDSDGSEADNIELSTARANAVAQYLIENGLISPDLVKAKGRGAEDPVGDNTTEEGREDNRRAELVFEQVTAAEDPN